MCRLICAFVVCIGQKQVFSWRGSYVSLLPNSYSIMNEPPSEKTCLWAFNQVRLKLACSTTEASKSLGFTCLATRFRQRTTKMLSRLRGCTDWSICCLHIALDRFLVTRLKWFWLTDRITTYWHMLEPPSQNVMALWAYEQGQLTFLCSKEILTQFYRSVTN